VSPHHYVREPGAEGQILTAEGAAPGTPLDELIERERPPLRAALEIGAAMADLLCIAREDGEIHGDIRPAHVRVDAQGAVAIEGWGTPRRVTRAPEGRTDDASVDMYGLGIVLHTILSSEPAGTLPDEAEAHDEEVVARVVAMDFSQVEGRRWVEDVWKFLCQILAWRPAERPQPLDAANVLASVAAQCPSDNLTVWAARAAGSRARRAPTSPPVALVPEALSGPTSLTAPMQRGMRQAPASKGESTSFWSREKIAAMLDDDDAPAPSVTTGASPRREELSAPRALAPAEPPAPRMAPPPRVEPPSLDIFPAPRPVAMVEPESIPPSRTRDVLGEPAAPPTPSLPRAPAAPVPTPAPPRVGATPRPVRELSEDEPGQTGSGTKWLVVAAVVVVLALLVCGGVTVMGGGAWFWASQEVGTVEATDPSTAPAAPPPTTPTPSSPTGTTSADPPAPAPSPAPAASPAPPPSAPPTTSSGSTAPKSSASSSSSGSKSSTSSAPKSSGSSASSSSSSTASRPATGGGASTRPASSSGSSGTTRPSASTATAAPAATDTFTVRFSAPGQEGKLECGDGQTAEFVGATNLTFTAVATCRVKMGGGFTVVQVSRTATVTCSVTSGRPFCTGA
jgi:hypothetical protein